MIAGYTFFRLNAYGAIPNYQSLLDRNLGARDAMGNELDSNHCGTVSPVSTDPHAGDFTDACRASQRSRIAGLATFGAALVGVSALIYVVATSPSPAKESAAQPVPTKKKRKVAFSPVVTDREAGAMLSLTF